jgi:hypothetical protein
MEMIAGELMMASKDDVDIAQEQEEYARQEAMFQFQKHAFLKPGFCHNCAAPTPEQFCDRDCRQDYEHREQVNNKTRSHA